MSETIESSKIVPITTNLQKILENPVHIESKPEAQKFINFINLLRHKEIAITPENTEKIREGIRTNIPPLNNLDELWTQYEKCFFIRKKRWRPEKKNMKWKFSQIVLFTWIICEYSVIQKISVDSFQETDWKYISALFPNISSEKCRYKWFTMQKCSAQRDSWSKEEDELLTRIVKKHKNRNSSARSFKWTKIAADLNQKKIGHIIRLAKHCRERWLNHLDPSISKEGWTLTEDLFLLKKIKELGKKWSKISKAMKGRHENSVKNRYISIIRTLRKNDKTVCLDDINEIIELFKNRSIETMVSKKNGKRERTKPEGELEVDETQTTSQQNTTEIEKNIPKKFKLKKLKLDKKINSKEKQKKEDNKDIRIDIKQEQDSNIPKETPKVQLNKLEVLKISVKEENTIKKEPIPENNPEEHLNAPHLTFKDEISLNKIKDDTNPLFPQNDQNLLTNLNPALFQQFMNNIPPNMLQNLMRNTNLGVFGAGLWNPLGLNNLLGAYGMNYFDFLYRNY